MRVLLLTAMVVLAACAPAALPPTSAPSKAPEAAKPAPTAAVAKPAASPAAKSEHSAEVVRLIAAARAAGERELDLSWGEDQFGGAEGAKKFEAFFNRLYGTDVKFQFTPGPTFPQMAAKVSQEVAAGQKAFTDLLPGASVHFGPLVERGALEEYDYTQLAPRISREVVAPRNIGVEVNSRAPGSAYNTDLVGPEERPRKLEDVLNPKWKGKIAGQPNAANLDSVAMRPEWGAEKMKAFVARLAEHIGGLIQVDEHERVASGEFIVLVMAAGSHEVSVYRARGAPVAHVIHDDGAILTFRYMGVPRTAGHPNLAKLFINMMLTEEGQRLQYDIHKADYQELVGSQSGGEINDLKARGIQPLRINAKFVAEHPDQSKLQQEFQAILREKAAS